MSEKTEIAVSVMPKLEERVVELSDKLEQIAKERAPEAWDAALKVVQVDAAQKLLVVGLAALVAFIAYRVGMHFMGVARMKAKNDRERTGNEWHSADDHAEFIPGLIGFIVCGMGSLLALIVGSHIWNYVALFHPELVIARRVLDGIL